MHQYAIRSLLVAVSGGADSIALLRLLAEAKECFSLSLYTAHVNHALRGQEADADQSLVEEACKELGLPLFTKKIESHEWESCPGTGTEEKARNIRYAFFFKVMEMHNIDTLAMGHHRDDLLETLLFNLVRGTSPEKFAHLMPMFEPKRRIMRPLLPFNKEILIQFLQEQHLPFGIDKTNWNQTFSRNILRHQVIPGLKKINPKADHALFRFREILALEQDYLFNNLKDLLNPPFWENLLATEGFIRFRRPLYLKLHPAYQLRIIRETRRQVVGHGKDFYFHTINSICKGIQQSPQFRYNDNMMKIWTRKNWVYFKHDEKGNLV